MFRYPHITPALRMEAVRVMLNMTKKELWAILKVNQFTYTKVIKNKKPMPTEWMKYFCENHHVSPSWLILGKGEVFC